MVEQPLLTSLQPTHHPDPIAIDPTATESRLRPARNTPFSTAPAITGQPKANCLQEVPGHGLDGSWRRTYSARGTPRAPDRVAPERGRPRSQIRKSTPSARRDTADRARRWSAATKRRQAPVESHALVATPSRLLRATRPLIVRRRCPFQSARGAVNCNPTPAKSRANGGCARVGSTDAVKDAIGRAEHLARSSCVGALRVRFTSSRFLCLICPPG